MKDRKNLLLILPILVFAFTFLILKIFSDSYANTNENTTSIPEGTSYVMERKNIYSWHLITNNFFHDDDRNASGTKIVRNDTYNSREVVYCAQSNTPLSKDDGRKRYTLNSSMVDIGSDDYNYDVKEKLSQTMPKMYPYISLTELKTILRNSMGDTYTNYNFDNLTAQEAITAVQAAIWNIIEGKSPSDEGYHEYRLTVADSYNCDWYYNENKILTAEEEAWHQASGCSTSGNFYKFVGNGRAEKVNGVNITEKRINALIEWYLNYNGDTSPSYVNINSNFNNNTNTLTVTVNTNLTSYTTAFKDQQGNSLNRTDTGCTDINCVY